MPGSVRLVEEALLEQRLRLKRSPVLVSAIMSAVTDEVRWGNHWLAKERAELKPVLHALATFAPSRC